MLGQQKPHDCVGGSAELSIEALRDPYGGQFQQNPVCLRQLLQLAVGDEALTSALAQHVAQVGKGIVYACMTCQERGTAEHFYTV